jgi:hypothetical protein
MQKWRKPIKGNTVIIINKAEYQNKIDESMNNNTSSLISTNLANSFRKQLEKDLDFITIIISKDGNIRT